MPDITITVSDKAIKIVQYIANRTGKTPIQIVEQLLMNWANGQIDGFFIEKLNNMTLQEKINLLGDIE